MKITTDSIKSGDTVEVRTNFGRGPVVEGTVLEVEENIKNGFPGLSYKVKGGSEHDCSWCYLDQVVTVRSM